MMFQRFTWRGEVIPDIDAWAHARGERIVHYKHTTRTVYGHEVDEGRMPESFWNSLLIRGNESYEELTRE
jgi:hypothetical protein